jgi:hypothetical protein
MAVMTMVAVPAVVMPALMIAGLLSMVIHAGFSLFTRGKLATPGG